MLSVVIPNWNGLRFLPTYLNALRHQTFRDFETIVVDNGSTDGSRERIAIEFPEVQIVPLETNRGFAPAVNAGIRAARGDTHTGGMSATCGATGSASICGAPST